MTLHEVDVLAVRWRRKQAREVQPMALLLQAFWNVHRDQEQQAQPITLKDVMTWLGHGEAVQESVPEPTPTPQEVLERVRMLHQVYASSHGQGEK